ncbi:hypothetical protein [Mycolicibacterium novocastrense]|uniref:hypothetical protein n=1 Tax=Mycolicibacterium novocastrense TaxID=59813 RepID=UPI0021F34595|nr:hypothetical protein [Mycolicibacterium novocastrense]
MTEIATSTVPWAHPVASAVPSRTSTRPSRISAAHLAAAISRMVAEGSTATTSPVGAVAAAASLFFGSAGVAGMTIRSS